MKLSCITTCARLRVAKCSPSVLKIGQLNAQSLGNKFTDINDLITEHQLSLFAVLETWHDSIDSPTVIASTLPGYRFLEKSRQRTSSQLKCNHEGICVFLKSHFTACLVTLPVYDTFEALLLTVRHGAINATLLTLYRPGLRAITNDDFFHRVCWCFRTVY